MLGEKGRGSMKCSLQSPSYLVRNVHSYCFRVIVPRDLRGFVWKTELRLTLRTGAIGIAKVKSRFLAGRIQFFFKVLRRGFLGMGKLSEDQIQQLVGKYIKKSVPQLDNQVYEGPAQVPGKHRPMPWGLQQEVGSFCPV